MRSDLNETYKIINAISNYSRYFPYFSSDWKFITDRISTEG